MSHNVTEISINRVSARPASRSKSLVIHKITSFLELLLKTESMCCYLFTIGLLKRRHRSLIPKISVMISLHLFVKKYIPAVEITTLVPSQISVQLCEQTYRMGNIGLNELLVIAELLQARQPAACFEIGTFDGRT